MNSIYKIKFFILSIVIVFLSSSEVFADSFSKSDAINYLNSLRSSAGLSTLSQNNTLDTAAQNHINYLVDTNLNGHYENNSSYPSSYYTGDTPSERGNYAGWRGGYYSENYSSGQNGIYDSIDGLMAAIYHRYGFLDNSIDSIGIGVSSASNHRFNYNMANSMVDILCFGTSYSGNSSYYSGVCGHDSNFKIEATNYENELHSLANNSPDNVIWPPNGSSNIPPAFFEESPDPLPNQSVSGYPISIEFNYYKYAQSTVGINSFKLYDDETGLEITNTLLMNASNDPNAKHTEYQFTLFPIERLSWNHRYRVEVNYSIDDISDSKTWSFTTKNLENDIIEVSSGETVIVNTNTTYALYFHPTNVNDTFNGIQYSYNTSSQIIDIKDGNTLLVTLGGNNGQYCNIDLKKDGSTVKTVRIEIGTVASSTPIVNNAVLGNEIVNGSVIATNNNGNSTDIRETLSIGGTSITHYRYKLDTQNYSIEYPISILINLESLIDGTHTIKVIGYDGNQWQSETNPTTVSFTVDNTAPSQVSYSLATNSQISQNTTIVFSSNSTDIKYTTEDQMTLTNMINGTSFDVTSINNGTLTLKAIAIDEAKNISVLSDIIYSVNIEDNIVEETPEPNISNNDEIPESVTINEEIEDSETTEPEENKDDVVEQETDNNNQVSEPVPINNEDDEVLDAVPYEINGDTIFRTNFEGLMPVYSGDSITLQTPTIIISSGIPIFVKLFANSTGDVQITMNIDNHDYKLPEFDSGAEISVEELDDNMSVIIKTKLTKTLNFQGRR